MQYHAAVGIPASHLNVEAGRYSALSYALAIAMLRTAPWFPELPAESQSEGLRALGRQCELRRQAEAGAR